MFKRHKIEVAGKPNPLSREEEAKPDLALAAALRKKPAKSRLMKALRTALAVLQVSAALSLVAVSSAYSTNELPIKQSFIVRSESQYARSDKAMKALQEMYDPMEGLWGEYHWQSANTLETVMDNALQTDNKKYLWDIYNTFFRNNGSNFINMYEDDNGWWAITWIKAYDLTHSREYLKAAKLLFTEMASTWGEACGGGILWNRTVHSYSSEAAISNEEFLKIASLMHERTPGDTYYLNWANREYKWFMARGYITSSHLVSDGLNSNCKGNDNSMWTYDQGEMIGALVAYSQATDNKSYLSQAEQIADANDRYNVDKNGILTERICCYSDSEDFKGIYIKNLYTLYLADHRAEYKDFIIKNADAIWQHDTNNQNFTIGYNWDGPLQDATPGSQTAGVDALSAAAALSPPKSQVKHAAH